VKSIRPTIYLVTDTLQNYFVVSRRKKFIWSWNNLRVSKS